jgi:hypothetical protein
LKLYISLSLPFASSLTYLPPRLKISSLLTAGTLKPQLLLGLLLKKEKPQTQTTVPTWKWILLHQSHSNRSRVMSLAAAVHLEAREYHRSLPPLNNPHLHPVAHPSVAV